MYLMIAASQCNIWPQWRAWPLQSYRELLPTASPWLLSDCAGSGCPIHIGPRLSNRPDRLDPCDMAGCQGRVAHHYWAMMTNITAHWAHFRVPVCNKTCIGRIYCLQHLWVILCSSTAESLSDCKPRTAGIVVSPLGCRNWYGCISHSCNARMLSPRLPLAFIIVHARCLLIVGLTEKERKTWVQRTPENPAKW